MAASALMVDSVVNMDTNVKSLKSEEKSDDFLNIFWILSESSEDKRENAVIQLVKRISEEQSQYVTVDKCCPSLEYAVERLVRGLSSSNKASRLGFYVALVQLLRFFPQLKLDQVYELAKKHHYSSSGKHETSDSLIGLSLSCGSLIRCGRLPRDLNLMSRVVSDLLMVITRKEYLRELCSSLLIELLDVIDELVFKKSIFPLLTSHLQAGFDDCLIDMFRILVVCSRKYPSAIDQKFLKKHWGVNSLSRGVACDSIAKILLRSSKSVPRIHPVCIDYLVSLLPTVDNLLAFWKIMTKAAFEKQKKEDLYLMFELLREMLPSLTAAEQIRGFLLPDFIRTLFVNLVRRQMHLHSVAAQLANALVTFVMKTENGGVQLEVLKLLLLPPGSVLFDQVTHTRTVSSMVPHLKHCAVSGLIAILKNVFFEAESETNRAAALRQLSRLVQHSSMKQESESQIGLLQFLALHAFFEHKATSSEIPETDKLAPRVSTYLRTTAGDGLYSALGAFHKARANPSLKNFSSSLRQHFSVLHALLRYIDLLLRNPEVATPLLAWSDAVQEAFDGVLKVVRELQKRSEKDGCVAESHAFQILFLHLGLHLFSETRRTLEILSDLHVCCRKALKERRRRSMRRAEKDGGADGEPEWIQVVIDLLLSLLSENSNWMRAVTQQVFTLLVPHLTLSSLDQIVDVLGHKVSSAKTSLTDDDSELVQFSSGSSDSEEDEVVDDGKTQAVDETELLRKSVKAALGDAAADSEQEASDLDDEAMMQLDDTLAEAFRSVMKKTNRFSKENETLVHFQNRCLDLIEIIILFRPNITFLSHLIFPLLSVAEYGLKAKNCLSLGQKALNCLQKLVNTKKFEESNELNLEVDFNFKQMLDDLMSKSHKVVDYENSQLIATVCTFVVKCSMYVDQRNETLTKKKRNARSVSQVDGCMEVYKRALKNFFDKGDCYTSKNIFTSLIARYLNLGWQLADILLNFSFQTDVRLFKKTQAIEMLSSLTASPNQVQKLISADRWAEVSTDCIPKMTKSLEEMVEQEKRNHIAALLNLAVNILNVDAQFGRETQHSESLIEAVKSLKTIKGWNAKQSRNNVYRLINIKIQKATNGETGTKGKSKKKKGSAGENVTVNNSVVVDRCV